MARATGRARGRGFSLVELLVVMATILLLIALFVGVGRSVFDTSRKVSAQASLATLDTLLSRYISTNGETLPPAVWTPDDQASSPLLYPILDGRNFSANDGSARLVSGRFSVIGEDGQLVRVTDPTVTGPRTINSGGMMFDIFRRDGLVSESTEGLPSGLIQLYTPYDISAAGRDEAVPELPTPIDPWGRPFRFVHPAADGVAFGGSPETPAGVTTVFGQPGTYLANANWAINSIRRNAEPTNGTVGTIGGLEDLADSDGGQAPNQRPYWYSAGPDGDPSTVDDNVYTLKPVLPQRN